MYISMYIGVFCCVFIQHFNLSSVTHSSYSTICLIWNPPILVVTVYQIFVFLHSFMCRVRAKHSSGNRCEYTFLLGNYSNMKSPDSALDLSCWKSITETRHIIGRPRRLGLAVDREIEAGRGEALWHYSTIADEIKRTGNISEISQRRM